MSNDAIAIIPARYGSTRFPGKLLARQTGKPLIQHVVEAVRQAKSIKRIIVATDDKRIADAIAGSTAQSVLTRQDHPNGTSRIAEVVQNLPAQQQCPIIVNVQGDEPEIEPSVIDQLVSGLQSDPQVPMATVASAFVEGEDPTNPNIVKVVTDVRSRAIYFSRSLIPYDRGDSNVRPPLKHAGVYAYRRDFLLTYVALQPTALEQTEQLEQLRALEHGYPIAVIEADCRHHGIDTPQQYEEFVKRQKDVSRSARRID